MLPVWLPPAVARHIQKLAAHHGDSIGPLLERLATDPRMRSFWKTIYRRNSEPGMDGQIFLYTPCRQTPLFDRPYYHLVPAGSRMFLYDDGTALQNSLANFNRLIEAGEWDALQDAAACILADMALLYAYVGLRTWTARQLEAVETQRSELLARIATVRDGVAAFGLSDALHLLDQAAIGLIFHRRYLAPDDPLLVKRERTDVAARGFVIAMGLLNVYLFGDILAGSVATIANALLRRDDLTGPRIKEMTRKIRAEGREWWVLGAPTAAVNTEFRQRSI
jgi:hypothetical protein